MIVLDTDHVSLLEWDYDGSAPLRERLADLPADEVATTIISYEESMRGWMARIHASCKRIDDRYGVVGHAGVEILGVQRADPGFDTGGNQQTVPIRQAVSTAQNPMTSLTWRPKA